jgi:hypothetical protein
MEDDITDDALKNSFFWNTFIILFFIIIISVLLTFSPNSVSPILLHSK